MKKAIRKGKTMSNELKPMENGIIIYEGQKAVVTT